MKSTFFVLCLNITTIFLSKIKQMNLFFFQKLSLLLFFYFFFTSHLIFSQSPWASSVHEYSFGTGQNTGQGTNYFPHNVLGSVSASVSATTPAALPEEVVSLGRNGWISVGFESPIINGAGADFTVFENAFEITGGLGIFDEWLIVSVSNDGENWFTFPYDSLTGEGMAGRTPTNGGNVNYLDATQSGGDSFDIGELGLNEVKYVRVQDATRFQSSDKLSAELDAVIALHQLTTPIENSNISSYEVYIAENQLFIHAEKPLEVSIYNLQGQFLESINYAPTPSYHFSLENWAKGLYFLRINNEETRKFILK